MSISLGGSAGAWSSSMDDDGVLVITLDRGDKLNAVTPEMTLELLAALDQVDVDDDVRAVVMTGSGRAFSAGADLSDGADAIRSAASTHGVREDLGGTFVRRIYRLRKPIVAAINGPAVGFGAAMTLPMDMRIAGPSTRIGFPYVRRGISPEGCSSWFLSRLIGTGHALDLMLSGRLLDSAEAHSLGLVTSVVPDGDVLPRAVEVAAKWARFSAPVSVAVTRRLVWEMAGPVAVEQAHKVESVLLHELSGRADAVEGVKSFLDDRTPEFQVDVADYFNTSQGGRLLDALSSKP